MTRRATPSSGGPTGFNAASRALRVRTLTPAEVLAALGNVGSKMIPFADATDNVIEQSVQSLVEMVAFPEITFATNRCINFDRTIAPAVAMLASNMTVTGNRVKHGGVVPSLAVLFDKALSAVGNMTTGGASVFAIAGAIQVPAPYPSFNAATT